MAEQFVQMTAQAVCGRVKKMTPKSIYPEDSWESVLDSLTSARKVEDFESEVTARTYEMTAQFVCGILKKIAPKSISPEDFLSESIFRFIRSVGKGAIFNSELAIRTYVSKIAMNLLRDHLRLLSSTEQPFTNFKNSQSEEVGSYESFDQKWHESEIDTLTTSEFLRESISQLPHTLEQVITTKFFGLPISDREAAKKLGISQANFNRRKLNAIKMLRYIFSRSLGIKDAYEILPMLFGHEGASARRMHQATKPYRVQSLS